MEEEDRPEVVDVVDVVEPGGEEGDRPRTVVVEPATTSLAGNNKPRVILGFQDDILANALDNNDGLYVLAPGLGTVQLVAAMLKIQDEKRKYDSKGEVGVTLRWWGNWRGYTLGKTGSDMWRVPMGAVMSRETASKQRRRLGVRGRPVAARRRRREERRVGRRRTKPTVPTVPTIPTIPTVPTIPTKLLPKTVLIMPSTPTAILGM